MLAHICITKIKKRAFFVACIFSCFLISCRNIGQPVNKQKSGSYFIDSKGQIAYCQNGNWFSLGISQMQADAKSFEVLSEDIAKDKNAVYFRGMPKNLWTKVPFMLTSRFQKIVFTFIISIRSWASILSKAQIRRHMKRLRVI